MTKSYQIVPPSGSLPTLDLKQVAELLAKDGQLFLPLLDLLESAQCAIDGLIGVLGRATIEAVLPMSAEKFAGPKQLGRSSDRDIVYHGTQRGRVALKDRQLNVEKPRLRCRVPKEGEPSEVEIPTYEAMRKDGRPAQRMLEIVIAGVSTRRYEQVLRNFSLHLIVRTPRNMEWRLREGDWFLREVVGRGKVLYESAVVTGLERPRSLTPARPGRW